MPRCYTKSGNVEKYEPELYSVWCGGYSGQPWNSSYFTYNITPDSNGNYQLLFIFGYNLVDTYESGKTYWRFYIDYGTQYNYVRINKWLEYTGRVEIHLPISTEIGTNNKKYTKGEIVKNTYSGSYSWIFKNLPVGHTVEFKNFRKFSLGLDYSYFDFYFYKNFDSLGPFKVTSSDTNLYVLSGNKVEPSISCTISIGYKVSNDFTSNREDHSTSSSGGLCDLYIDGSFAYSVGIIGNSGGFKFV